MLLFARTQTNVGNIAVLLSDSDGLTTQAERSL